MSGPPEPPPLPSPPAPLPEAISDQWKGTYWAPRTYLRGHLFVHAAAFYVVAASLAIQPERYTPDRWRGLLFIIAWATPTEWAAVFCGLATLKLASGFLYPRLARPALAVGAAVLTWWTVGLALAWWDSNATVIPLILAALDLGEHFAAATLLDGRRRWRH